MSPLPPAGPGTARRTSLAVPAVCGLAGSTLLALVGNSGAAHSAARYWPWVPPLSGSVVGAAAALGWSRAGLALLVLAWFALGRQLTRGLAARQVLHAAGLWAVPLLLAPPLFSDDAFSYVASGALQTHGLDPYLVGPAHLGPGVLTGAVSPTWLHATSPYGPGFLLVTRAVAAAAGDQPVLAVVLLRAVSVAAVAGTAWALYWLAGRAGTEPAAALWLAVANPLVLVDEVSGAHNDALMTALLLAAFVVHHRGHRYPAVLLTAAAAQVKVLAVAATLVLLLQQAAARGGTGRLRELTARAGLAVGCAAALTSVCGLALGHGALGGWGWVPALTVPGRVLNTITPLDALWDLVPGLHLTGLVHGRPQTLPPWQQSGLSLLRLAAETASAALALVLAGRTRQLGPERTTGLILLTLALLGPVLWPWYVLCPLTLLAVNASVRERAAVGALSVLLLAASGPGGRVLWGQQHRWPGPHFTDTATLLLTVALATALLRPGRLRPGRLRPDVHPNQGG